MSACKDCGGSGRYGGIGFFGPETCRRCKGGGVEPDDGPEEHINEAPQQQAYAQSRVQTSSAGNMPLPSKHAHASMHPFLCSSKREEIGPRATKYLDLKLQDISQVARLVEFHEIMLVGSDHNIGRNMSTALELLSIELAGCNLLRGNRVPGGVWIPIHQEWDGFKYFEYAIHNAAGAAYIDSAIIFKGKVLLW